MMRMLIFYYAHKDRVFCRIMFLSFIFKLHIKMLNLPKNNPNDFFRINYYFFLFRLNRHRGASHALADVRLRRSAALQRHRLRLSRLLLHQGHRVQKQGRRRPVAHVLGRLLGLLHRRILLRHSRRMGPLLLVGKGNFSLFSHELNMYLDPLRNLRH